MIFYWSLKFIENYSSRLATMWVISIRCGQTNNQNMGLRLWWLVDVSNVTCNNPSFSIQRQLSSLLPILLFLYASSPSAIPSSIVFINRHRTCRGRCEEKRFWWMQKISCMMPRNMRASVGIKNLRATQTHKKIDADHFFIPNKKFHHVTHIFFVFKHSITIFSSQQLKVDDVDDLRWDSMSHSIIFNWPS